VPASLNIAFNQAPSVLTASPGRYGIMAPALALTETGSGPPVSGYDGVIAVNAAGQFVNGHNVPIQLRATNAAYMVNSIYSGYSGDDAKFGAACGRGGPPWGTLALTRKLNAVRIVMDTTAFMNVPISVIQGSASSPSWNGTTHAGDPNGVIKPGFLNSIFWARYFGLYVIVNAHWSAPAYTFGGVKGYVGAYGQPLFLDYDQGYQYWAAPYGGAPGTTDASGYASSGMVAFLASQLGSAAFNTANGIPGAGGVVGAAGQFNDPTRGGSSGFQDIIFELFNEPQLDQQNVNFNTANGGTGSALTLTKLMGQGGWCSGYNNQNIGTGTLNPGGIQVGIPSGFYGASGQPNTTTSGQCFNWWWRVAGYQQVLTGIRSFVGCNNICTISGPAYATGFTNITDYFPTDPLSGPPQLAHNWHPYGSNYPNSPDPNFSYGFYNTAYALQVLQNVIQGQSSYTVDGQAFTGIGYPLPAIAGEFGVSNSSGTPPYIVSMTQWADGGTSSANGTSFTPGFSTSLWASPDPGGITNYGGNPASNMWQGEILGAPQTITASISTTVPTGFNSYVGTITITNANGNTIDTGWVVTGGAGVPNGVIGPQISGTTQGAGTYAFSIGQTQSATTLTIQKWLPAAGEGSAYFAWTEAHA